MPTVEQQAEIFLTQLRTRRRNPVKPATLRCYDCYLKMWIIPMFGDRPLETIENGEMRALVSKLVKADKKPATIAGVVGTLKSLVSSDTDENGNIKLVRKWNADFIDAPQIFGEEQKSPIMTPAEVTGALQRSSGQYRALYALLAGTGLRIGEALALKMGPAPDEKRISIWDPVSGTIYVRQTTNLLSRKEQPPKTQAAHRDVDVYRDLTAFLRKEIQRSPGELVFQTRNAKPLNATTLYKHACEDKIPGFHSFRRFRATYLDSLGVAESLIAFWLGHSKKTVTQKYVKVGKGMDLRRGWCDKAGLGFDLPKENTNEMEIALCTNVDELVGETGAALPASE